MRVNKVQLCRWSLFWCDHDSRRPNHQWLIFTIPELQSIPATDIYEDTGPHRSPPLYFLAALVYYSALYKEPIPLEYTVPESMVSSSSVALSVAEQYSSHSYTHESSVQSSDFVAPILVNSESGKNLRQGIIVQSPNARVLVPANAKKFSIYNLYGARIGTYAINEGQGKMMTLPESLSHNPFVVILN